MLGILYSVLMNGMVRPPNDGVHLETPQAQTVPPFDIWRKSSTGHKPDCVFGNVTDINNIGYKVLHIDRCAIST